MSEEDEKKKGLASKKNAESTGVTNRIDERMKMKIKVRCTKAHKKK